MKKTRQMMYCGVMIALGIVLPIGFHAIGAAGPIFLPMHIPVFIAGILLGPLYGMLAGLITPIMSSFMTGMPPLLPMLPIMVMELALYGLSIGLLTKKKVKIYLALVVSMISGRIGAGLVVWVLVHGFDFARLPANPAVYIWASIVQGLPGIVIQFILIPLVVYYLGKELQDVKRVL